MWLARVLIALVSCGFSCRFFTPRGNLGDEAYEVGDGIQDEAWIGDVRAGGFRNYGTGKAELLSLLHAADLGAVLAALWQQDRIALFDERGTISNNSPKRGTLS